MNLSRRLAGLSPVLALLSLPLPAAADAPRLALPLDCEPGRTCFVQNYVDLDAGPRMRDYRCGEHGYDGHKGVDFRILSMKAMTAGVEVRAAAAGVVLRLRDGVADQPSAMEKGKDIEGRECGNGIVVSHGNGWETQYCHLRQGSIKVRPGERVAAGAVLGLVGLSGWTAFPHLHLELRHDGRTVDPFSGREPGPGEASCDATAATSKAPLFEDRVLQAFPYRSGEALHVGFAAAPPSIGSLMAEGDASPPADVRVPALVFYGLALNLREGDRLRARLDGPEGNIADETSAPLDRHKAHYLSFAGRKRRGAAWPTGTYAGLFALIRDGATVWEEKRELRLE